MKLAVFDGKMEVKILDLLHFERTMPHSIIRNKTRSTGQPLARCIYNSLLLDETTICNKPLSDGSNNSLLDLN